MCYFLLKTITAPPESHFSCHTPKSTSDTRVCSRTLPPALARGHTAAPSAGSQGREGWEGPQGITRSNLHPRGEHRALPERCTLRRGYVWPRRSGRLREAPAPALHSGHGLWPSRPGGTVACERAALRERNPGTVAVPGAHLSSPRAAVGKGRSRARPSLTPSPPPGATAALTVRSGLRLPTCPAPRGGAGRTRLPGAAGRVGIAAARAAGQERDRSRPPALRAPLWRPCCCRAAGGAPAACPERSAARHGPVRLPAGRPPAPARRAWPGG